MSAPKITSSLHLTNIVCPPSLSLYLWANACSASRNIWHNCVAGIEPVWQPLARQNITALKPLLQGTIDAGVCSIFGRCERKHPGFYRNHCIATVRYSALSSFPENTLGSPRMRFFRYMAFYTLSIYPRWILLSRQLVWIPTTYAQSAMMNEIASLTRKALVFEGRPFRPQNCAFRPTMK